MRCLKVSLKCKTTQHYNLASKSCGLQLAGFQQVSSILSCVKAQCNRFYKVLYRSQKDSRPILGMLSRYDPYENFQIFAMF